MYSFMKNKSFVLGTAQFGFKYGVNNNNGPVTYIETKKNFRFCKKII